MKERPCGLCGNADAWVYRTGPVLEGGYGSSAYDTTRLILTDEARLNGADRLCDACVAGLEKDGATYAYVTVLGDAPAQAMPAAAYAAIFAHHAGITLETLQKHGVERDRFRPQVTPDQIEALRADLEHDPPRTRSFRAGQANFATETVRVARAHVLAAIALGAPLDDETIEEAARRYGEVVAGRVDLTESLIDDLIDKSLTKDR
jgi:hypothetical protein